MRPMNLTKCLKKPLVYCFDLTFTHKSKAWTCAVVVFELTADNSCPVMFS